MQAFRKGRNGVDEGGFGWVLEDFWGDELGGVRKVKAGCRGRIVKFWIIFERKDGGSRIDVEMGFGGIWGRKVEIGGER